MERIIVSLTSYPKRIHTIHKVLDSIIGQTVSPDKIVLYLSSSEFREFGKLPDFTKYTRYGFEIHWNEENMLSHKKWFYAFREYPNDIVVTIDDDILYKNTALEILLRYHTLFPECVVARNAAVIISDKDGGVAPYEVWCSCSSDYVGIPRMDLAAIGNGGILYPVHLFQMKEIFDANIFMEKCRYADDLWMKVMEVYSGIPAVLAEKRWNDAVLAEHQSTCLFQDYNKDGGNDRQLQALLQQYPYTYQKEKLIDSIFSGGHMFCKEEKEFEKMDCVLDELAIRLGDYKKLIIYGAGDVGRRLYYLLKRKFPNLIESFVVEDISINVREIENIEVKSYREFLDGKEKILIALLDGDQEKEVKYRLIAEGVNKNRIITMDGYEKKALMKRVWLPFSSGKYWEKRYVEGGNSGAGSYNRLAEFKAEIINKFVRDNNVSKIIEWGCGDGNQLKLAEYPEYIGYDVSKKAVKICREKFSDDLTKQFIWCGGDRFENKVRGDLSLSLDVIYHLIEDDVYEQYMEWLFSSSERYICIYSSNFEERSAAHVRNRKFTDWIEGHTDKEWRLAKIVRNRYPYSEDNSDETSWSDFYFYEKI